jgi:hypothetical protein
LLVASGLSDFLREHTLSDENSRRFRYAFTFLGPRVILETNGKRRHDDAADFQHDQHKWSVPTHHGFRLVLATWRDVTERSDHLIARLRSMLSY